MFFCEFCEISKNFFLNRTPLVAASVDSTYLTLKFELSLSKKKIICVNESPLKMMKNTFSSLLKALFVLKKLQFLSSLFGCVEKRLDKKANVNFKIHDITDWTANNYNTYIAQYRMKVRQPYSVIWSVIRK